MTDYTALAAELAKPEYAGLDDKARVERLNVAQLTRAQPIPTATVLKLWSRWMVLARAELAAQDTALDRELRVVCLATVRNLANGVFVDLDPEEPKAAVEIAAYLDALEAAGVLTADQRAETLALGQVVVPLREALGWRGEVRESDLAALRVIEREKGA